MIKKNEALLLLAVMLLAGAIYGIVRWTQKPIPTQGARVQVLVDGVEVQSFSADALGRHVIETSAGHNAIKITDAGVRMVEADCPDKWCVRKGLVSPGPDAIVCLPHRMIVRWQATSAPATPDEVDVVLQ